MKKSGRHPFKWMVYEGEKIRIDRDIVPLLSKMWEYGIHTTNSCQGVCSREYCKHKVVVKKLKNGNLYDKVLRTKNCGDRIWIAFASARDMERFYNLVAVYEKWRRGQPDSMYEKINGWAGRDVVKGGKFKFERNSDNWEVQLHMPNEGVLGHWIEIPNGFPNESKFITVWEEDECPRNNFRIQPQIWFPRKHLSYVMEKIELAVNRKRGR